MMGLAHTLSEARVPPDMNSKKVVIRTFFHLVLVYRRDCLQEQRSQPKAAERAM